MGEDTLSGENITGPTPESICIATYIKPYWCRPFKISREESALRSSAQRLTATLGPRGDYADAGKKERGGSGSMVPLDRQRFTACCACLGILGLGT